MAAAWTEGGCPAWDEQFASRASAGPRLERSYRVRPNDWILLYAAAGGVGWIAVQWARHLGARVIGVVGTPEKRRLALAHGCEHVLLAGQDIVARVRELTGGTGVPVVYDSVGRDTFLQSLDCLRPHGVLVSFGNASGPVEPFSPLELSRRGSLYVTRPTLFDFIRTRVELETGAAALFGVVSSGAVEIEIGQRYALADVARAPRSRGAQNHGLDRSCPIGCRNTKEDCFRRLGRDTRLARERPRG